MPRRLVWKDATWGASLTFQFTNTDEVSFPKSQLLLRINFSCSKHYRHWKCINIIQTLCRSPDRHFSKSGYHGSKSGQHLSVTHEARHPMLIHTWTASSEFGTSQAASADPSRMSTGPEFGLGDETVCLNHPGASSPPHGVSHPFAGFQEKYL